MNYPVFNRSKPLRRVLAQDPDVGEVAVALRVIEPVADDEQVLDGKAQVIDLDLDLLSRRLVEERAQLDRGRIARHEVLLDVLHREACIDDVFDDEDMLALDGFLEVEGDLDDTRRVGLVAVALHTEEL